MQNRLENTLFRANNIFSYAPLDRFAGYLCARFERMCVNLWYFGNPSPAFPFIYCYAFKVNFEG